MTFSSFTLVKLHSLYGTGTQPYFTVRLEPTIPDLGGDSNPRSFRWNHTPVLRTSWSSGSLGLSAERIQGEAKWQAKRELISLGCLWEMQAGRSGSAAPRQRGLRFDNQRRVGRGADQLLPHLGVDIKACIIICCFHPTWSSWDSPRTPLKSCGYELKGGDICQTIVSPLRFQWTVPLHLIPFHFHWCSSLNYMQECSFSGSGIL